MAAIEDGKVSRDSPAQAWLSGVMRWGRAAARPVVGAGIVATVSACVQAWAVAELVSVALGATVASVAAWAVVFALAALVRAAAGYAGEVQAFEAGAAARRRLRTTVFDRVLAGGRSAVHGGTGEAMTLAIDQVEALDGLFSRWLPAAILAVVSPGIVAVAVLLVDPVAALILLGMGLLVPVGMALAGLGAAAASRRQFESMARLQARFLDRVRGIATIVLAGRAGDEALQLQAAAADLRVRTMRVLRLAFLSSAALDCAAAGALVILALRYAAQWHPGQEVADAVFVLVLAVEFFLPLRTFSAAYQDRMQAAGAADAFAALPEPAAAAGTPRTVTASGVTVAFDGVTFAWDQARGPVLQDLSFRVPAGETVVVAGPSGAGKSTVIELLLGFVRPDAGRVTLNGVDIATITPQALSRMTAWIGQQPMLFAGSIRDNIRFGNPGATDAAVDRAAAAAGVSQFAAALPAGLDTRIGEGGYGLSGGQAQRVAIARAFVRNAPLLLLDEPTAHLDPATEADVLASLKRLALGRTVVLASHSAAAHAFSGRRLDLPGAKAQAAA